MLSDIIVLLCSDTLVWLTRLWPWSISGLTERFEGPRSGGRALAETTSLHSSEHVPNQQVLFEAPSFSAKSGVFGFIYVAEFM